MKIIGHRGAGGLAPENTLASIQKALDCRVDEIEIDVRVTKDLVPVLNHDKAIGRLLIAAHSLAELRKAKHDLTTLEEAINLVKGRVPLMLEAKPKVMVEPIVELLERLLTQDWKTRDFLLASKSQKTLRALHRALPKIEKVVIERWSGVKASYRTRQVDAKRLSMNRHFLWWGFISNMSKNGHYKLAAYTLNDPKKAEAWAKRGLYAVITDYPDRFRP